MFLKYISDLLEVEVILLPVVTGRGVEELKPAELNSIPRNVLNVFQFPRKKMDSPYRYSVHLKMERNKIRFRLRYEYSPQAEKGYVYKALIWLIYNFCILSGIQSITKILSSSKRKLEKLCFGHCHEHTHKPI